MTWYARPVRSWPSSFFLSLCCTISRQVSAFAHLTNADTAASSRHTGSPPPGNQLSNRYAVKSPNNPTERYSALWMAVKPDLSGGTTSWLLSAIYVWPIEGGHIRTATTWGKYIRLEQHLAQRSGQDEGSRSRHWKRPLDLCKFCTAGTQFRRFRGATRIRNNSHLPTGGCANTNSILQKTCSLTRPGACISDPERLQSRLGAQLGASQGSLPWT